MKKRPFTDTEISEIGLGCWQLGGSDWGALDDDRAFAILNTAVDNGVNFLDTADVYGDGRSETLIGRFLRMRSEKLFVATKLGRTAALFPDKYTASGVRAATEASLRRLGVESLDLTQLHCVPHEVLKQGEIFEWLRDLQREGKIQRFGASVESMDEAATCLAQPGLASLQIIFNIFRQKPIETLFPAALEKKDRPHHTTAARERAARWQVPSHHSIFRKRPSPLQSRRRCLQRGRDVRGPAL